MIIAHLADRTRSANSGKNKKSGPSKDKRGKTESCGAPIQSITDLYAGTIICEVYYKYLGDVVVQWLVRRTWDRKVESSSPGWCTHVVFFSKTLNSYSASLHPCA